MDVSYIKSKSRILYIFNFRFWFPFIGKPLWETIPKNYSNANIVTKFESIVKFNTSVPPCVYTLNKLKLLHVYTYKFDIVMHSMFSWDL